MAMDQQQIRTQIQLGSIEPTFPNGWRKCATKEGKIYYQNDITQQTSWNPSQPQSQPQSVELKVSQENNDVEKDDDNKSKVVSLEINDIGLEDTTQKVQIKHPKTVISLYIIFILCISITLLIQFTFEVENLILFVNICGGILLIIWVIYQFKDDNSLKEIFEKRDLYLPLLFHVIDTSSDLATIYVYYNYVSSLSNSSDADSEPDSWDTRRQAEERDTFYQIFLVSILIMVSYRIISSSIIYLNSRNIKLAILQLFDLYIYDILLKSWQTGKIKPSLLQSYIGELEAYFESFPQLIINARFLWNARFFFSDIDATVLFSLILSLVSVVGKSTKSDARFFKPDRNIIDLINKQTRCLNYKWIIHFIYRICDISTTVFIFVVIWYDFGGVTVVIIIFAEFIAAVFIATVFNPGKGLNFSLVSSVAITPIVSSKKADVFVIFIYKTIFFAGGIIVYLQGLFGSIAEGPSLFLELMIPTALIAFIMSGIYFFEGRRNLRCFCDVIKDYSINDSVSYQGIENVEELKDLLLFGFKLKRSSDIKECDYINMSNIVSVYKVIMSNIYKTNKEKENKFRNAWKEINNKETGNLLHQFCRNIRADNNIDETLSFIINDLKYDINQTMDNIYWKKTTPLMIAAAHQHNDIMVKLLVNKYDADISIESGDRSALDYANDFNRSSGKNEIITFLADKMIILQQTTQPQPAIQYVDENGNPVAAPQQVPVQQQRPQQIVQQRLSQQIAVQQSPPPQQVSVQHALQQAIAYQPPGDDTWNITPPLSRHIKSSSQYGNVVYRLTSGKWISIFGNTVVNKGENKQWKVKIKKSVYARELAADIVIGICDATKVQQYSKKTPAEFWLKPFNGYGYYGWNGRLYSNKKKGRNYATAFQVDDTITIEIRNNTLGFYRNNEYLGVENNLIKK